MPSLNFKPQFVPLILSGQKRQTIRPIRKDGKDIKIGDKLYLFTGLRTKKCIRILTPNSYNVYYDRTISKYIKSFNNSNIEKPYVICRDVKDVLIKKDDSDLLLLISSLLFITLSIDIKLNYRVYLNDMYLNQTELLDLAILDGFSSVGNFLDFFIKTYKFPFHAKLIKW